MKFNENTCPGINWQSADLSKSESVLAYIVIHQYLPILQHPISHYCNTLQSPILQFATYLDCKMQLALLHHLKGVGLRRHRAPQAGELSSSDSLKSF